MTQEKKQVSYDGGTSWSDVIPSETRAALPVIETESEDCGYVPPAPVGYKFSLALDNGETITAECDSTSAITSAETKQYSATCVSIDIGSCNTKIDYLAFYSFKKASRLTIPNTITTIASQAFFQCSGLTNVTIPNSVSSIGQYAFYNCSSLTNIDIPDSVTSIGYQTFAKCSGLTSITCEATTPPTLGSNAFDNTNNCQIYVPCESVDAYKAANNWSTYASRIEGIPPCEEPTPSCQHPDATIQIMIPQSYLGGDYSYFVITDEIIGENCTDWIVNSGSKLYGDYTTSISLGYYQYQDCELTAYDEDENYYCDISAPSSSACEGSNKKLTPGTYYLYGYLNSKFVMINTITMPTAEQCQEYAVGTSSLIYYVSNQL